MEFTELIKIKQIRNARCLLDVFSETPEGPGVVIVSAHVLCYESGSLKVCYLINYLFILSYKLINSFFYSSKFSLIYELLPPEIIIYHSF